jgi:hypothetical protein
MRKALHFIFAVVAGLIVGSVVNMALINLGARLMPMPGGVDTTTVEGLRASLPLFTPGQFVFPFLAHALGTLVGAVVATLLTPGRGAGPAWAVGVVFLAGGVASVFMLPAPVWFSAVDLLFAYLPSAWLGHRLAVAMAPRSRRAPA